MSAIRPKWDGLSCPGGPIRTPRGTSASPQGGYLNYQTYAQLNHRRVSEHSLMKGRGNTTLVRQDSIIDGIFTRFLYKEDVQELLDDLDLPVSGTKDELISRLLEHEDFDPEEALAYLDKEQFVALCDELDLPSRGTRDDLFKRVLEAIREEEKELVVPASDTRAEAEPAIARSSTPIKSAEASLPPPPPIWAYVHASQPPTPPTAPVPPVEERARRHDVFAQPQPYVPPLEFPESQSPTLIPEAHAPQIPQLQMISEFIEAYRPSRRFANEQAYEIELAQALRGRFGEENVKTQVTIYGGRIDIEVLGIGLEIKVPASRSQLQTLLGQISIYKNSYGSNLMIVIFNDLGKHQDVTEFSSLLRAKGIPVFVK